MAEVLAAHGIYGMSGGIETACRCNRKWMPHVEYRAHLEAELVAAGLGPVKEAKAEAWDEGFDRGFYDPLAGSGRDASESPARNPYENNR